MSKEQALEIFRLVRLRVQVSGAEHDQILKAFLVLQQLVEEKPKSEDIQKN